MPAIMWKKGRRVGSEHARAAAQADSDAGNQALATGQPLEELNRLACDWRFPKPAIGRQATFKYVRLACLGTFATLSD